MPGYYDVIKDDEDQDSKDRGDGLLMLVLIIVGWAGFIIGLSILCRHFGVID